MKGTVFVWSLIAHMGTRRNVTKARHSLTHGCTPTQTVKVISILSQQTVSGEETVTEQKDRMDGVDEASSGQTGDRVGKLV